MEPYTLKTFTLKDKSEVDLRVAQEIKNHQDWMYEVGQSIRILKEGLAALAAIHEKNLSKVQSEHKSVLIAFENLEENVLRKLDVFTQRIGDVETKCINLQLELGDKLYEFSQNYTTKEENVKSDAFLWSKFKELDEKMKSKNDFVDTQFIRSRSQLKEEIEGVRKEIPSIEEFKPLKKEMEETFQAFKVDFAGLIKEIALIKKAVAYDQKKFENIYTLIERLKEGKQ